METKTAWRLEQDAKRALEKEANSLVLAYYKKETHGKRVRHIPVSCPKRLLDLVQADGMEKYGKDFKFPPTAKEVPKE